MVKRHRAIGRFTAATKRRVISASSILLATSSLAACQPQYGISPNKPRTALLPWTFTFYNRYLFIRLPIKPCISQFRVFQYGRDERVMWKIETRDSKCAVQRRLAYGELPGGYITIIPPHSLENGKQYFAESRGDGLYGVSRSFRP